MMTLAQKLKEEMLISGIKTQVELAIKSNVAKDTISKIMRGDSLDISVSKLERIARALDLTLSEFLVDVDIDGSISERKMEYEKKYGKRECMDCGEQYIPHHEAQKYCSKKCSINGTLEQRTMQRNMVTFICEGCGDEFRKEKGHIYKFCSRKCASEAKVKKRKVILKRCERCGKQMRLLEGKNDKKRFCSHSCANKSRRSSKHE